GLVWVPVWRHAGDEATDGRYSPDLRRRRAHRVSAPAIPGTAVAAHHDGSDFGSGNFGSIRAAVAALVYRGDWAAPSDQRALAGLFPASGDASGHGRAYSDLLGGAAKGKKPATCVARSGAGDAAVVDGQRYLWVLRAASPVQRGVW